MKTCPYCNAAVEETASQCGSCRAALPGRNPALAGTAVAAGSPPFAQRGHRITLVESIDEIRQALQAQGLIPPIEPPAAAAESPAPRQIPAPVSRAADAKPFRPVHRPPMLLLCALDDGSRDKGEWHRVRQSPFVIGRTEGDLRIPHDEAMSSRHAELVRVPFNGKFRFMLRDLQSTNGTYVRGAKAILKDGQEILIGSRHYRFTGGAPKAGTRATSRSNQQPEDGDAGPQLVELSPKGPGQRHPLASAEVFLGSDSAQCSLPISGDPLVSPRHARLSFDGREQWTIESLKSLNGLWFRVTEMPFDTSGEFQIGEQRFLVHLC